MALEEQWVWEFVDNVPAASSDPQQLAQHNKMDAKAKRIILEGVKDHIIPHLIGMKKAKEIANECPVLEQGGTVEIRMVNETN